MYHHRVQAEFDFQRNGWRVPDSTSRSLTVLPISSGTVPITYVRSGKARRYILRIQPDGAARVTLPRWGSKGQAYAFGRRGTSWIEKQLGKWERSAFGPQTCS